MTTILDILGTSTPVSEVLAEKIGYVRAAIACRVFFYQQLDNGLCSASVNTLAKKLGMSAGAVSTNLKWLRENNYIKVVGEHKSGNVTNKYKVDNMFYKSLKHSADESQHSADESNIHEMNGKEEIKEEIKETTTNEQAHLSLSDTPAKNGLSDKEKIPERTNGQLSGTGKKPIPKDKSKAGEKPKPKTELMETFIECTGIKMPKRKTDRGFWWGSIGELYNIANEDADIGKKLIEYTVKKMRADNLTIGGPNSLIKTARDVMAQRDAERNAHSNNGFKPIPQPNDNYPYLRKGVSIG